MVGRRDIGLTPEGKQQAERGLQFLAGQEIAELLASPLARSIQTAEVYAQHLQVGIGRDPRLIDADVGRWEGAPWGDVVKEKEFQDLLAGDTDTFPGGESLENVQRRALASVEQSVADNPNEATILMVTHEIVIQLIVAQQMGTSLAEAMRLQIDHGSVTALRFASDTQRPVLLGVNLGVPLATVLDGPRATWGV